MRFVVIFVAGALSLATAAWGRDLRESGCNFVVENPDKTYSFRPNYNFSLIREARRMGTAFTVDSNEKVVGFSCLRSPLMPVPEDLLVMKAGYLVTIAGEEETSPIINMKMVKGRIVVSGDTAALGNREKRDFLVIITQMQNELDRTYTPQP